MVDVSTAKLKLDTREAVRDVRSFKKSFKGVNRDIKAANDNFKTLGKTGGATFKRLAVGATAFIAAFGIATLVRNVARVTAEFEDLKTALNAVFGSIEAGEKAFDFVQDFATKTPFSVQTLTQALIQLQGAGIEPTAELLTTFGNAASVTVDRLRTFNTMVRIVSRSTAGGLGLEEINQLVDAGIPVFQILERQLGITRLEISDFGRTAEGAKKIIDALLKGLNQRFGGAMAASLGNLSVAFSNFQIAVDNTLAVIGEGLGPALKAATLQLTEFIEQNNEAAAALGDALGEGVLLAVKAFEFFAENIETVKIALLGLLGLAIVKFFAGLVVAVEGAIVAIRLLTIAMLASPMAPFAIAAIAVGAAIGLIFLNADKTIPKIEALGNELDALANSSKPAADRLADVQEQIREINAAISERETKIEAPLATGRGRPSSAAGRNRAKEELADLSKQLEQATALRRQIAVERFKSRAEQQKTDEADKLSLRPKSRPDDVIAKIRKDAIAPLDQFVTALKNEEVQLRANEIALKDGELAAIEFQISQLDLTRASETEVAALKSNATELAKRVVLLREQAAAEIEAKEAIEAAAEALKEGEKQLNQLSQELVFREKLIGLTQKQIGVETTLQRARQIAAATGAQFNEAQLRADVERVQALEKEFADLQTVAQSFEDTVEGIFNDLAESGEISFEKILGDFSSLLASMASKAAASEISGLLFGSASSTGDTGSSFFSGIGSILSGLFKKGGKAENPLESRAVSPLAFVNAPRLKSGNLSAFGIQQDEIPALLHPGEVVIPANQVATAQQRQIEQPPNITINVQARDAESFIRAESEIFSRAFMEGERNRIRNRV